MLLPFHTYVRSFNFLSLCNVVAVDSLSLSMWESMRLRVVYMLSMKSKRLYDKWPIKYIKAISHSFSHQFIQWGAHIFVVCAWCVFFSPEPAIMCEFLVKHEWRNKKSTNKMKKEFILYENMRRRRKKKTHAKIHLSKK